MALRELARTGWQEYFDRVSKALGAERVTIEVTGPGLGDQFAAKRVALSGLSYDPKDEDLTVFAEGLEHRVHRPGSIHVDEEPGSLRSLEAVDGDGNRHIVQLIEPLRLPSP